MRALVQRYSFRLHQWLGLASAAVLLVVGLTGALLALRDDISALWPSDKVAVGGARLTPPQLLPLLAQPGKRLSRLYQGPPDEPGLVLYSGADGFSWQRFNPYSGALLGPRAKLDDFFDQVQALHRWLLLPRSAGSLITGTAALMAIGLLIAGIIRRAPDRLGNWRDWLLWKKGTRGRQSLWQWHALLGTWLFVPLLLMALTAPWFAFDWYRSGLTGLLASTPPARPQASKGPLDLEAAWRGYLEVQPGGNYSSWMLPRHPGEPVQVRYLEPGAPHSNAYSRISLDGATGAVLAQRRYSELKGGDYWLANVYALHTGLFFGLPGRLLWSLSALAFASFAVTGCWLFLQRRKRPRENGEGEALTLVAYASQSGTAAAQGQRLLAWLQGQGHAAHLKPLGALEPAQLAGYRQLLVLASTYGEGQAPDSALVFQQKLAQAALPLAGVKVAVLAFGDRQYRQFCAFGHWLAARLGQLGAEPLLPVAEVDRGSDASIADWQRALAGKLALAAPAEDLGWQQGLVLANRCLNPGGDRPVHELQLALPGKYQPGDLLEVLPAPGAAPRSYSIASAEGQVRLMVRQRILADGRLGLASGLLCQAKAGQGLQVRLRSHPGFRLPEGDSPLLLLGAGTGLAPYLGFLEARRAKGHKAPCWLIYGERRAEDHYYREALASHLAESSLSRLDLAWSRDQGLYVQDILAGQLTLLDSYLAKGAHLYVCGAIGGIGKGVQELLLSHLGAEGLAALVAEGRYHRDLY
ncbi:PepSY domain-containing protein [Gallaecimonas kandeliae]|uniref:PepSY domain-containing protein n=1 Tax=Gallaecimonas kandeliae TaxID=3029055 RepID=UPI00264A1E1E|nr:PepSY domain-containing protein [Gallaecimonas kandeliae]WKE65168.1 PepSY domain-containing protein [Gallaecimonas kandeliae]